VPHAICSVAVVNILTPDTYALISFGIPFSSILLSRCFQLDNCGKFCVSFRLSQRCSWGLSSLGMWHCVGGWMLRNISRPSDATPLPRRTEISNCFSYIFKSSVKREFSFSRRGSEHHDRLEMWCPVVRTCVDCVWNVMAHAQKPDSVFRRNGRVYLNRRGCQFSRLLETEVCALAVVMVVMLDTPCSVVVWKVLATHSIRQFPLHFPSHASPCAITFQLNCTKMHGFRSQKKSIIECV